MRLDRALVLPVLLALLAGTGTTVAAAQLRVMKEGEVLPARVLRGIDGQEVTLPAAFPAGEKGVTVVVFWSTWSPRSQPLLALWQKLAAENAARPVRVLTVNADGQEMDAAKVAVVKGYLAENGVTLPVVVDSGLSLYNEIGVIALPTTLFFRGDGALAGESPGFPSSAAVDLPAELDRHLGVVAEAPADTGHERGKLAYQPKNKALLYFGMGQNLTKMKMREKARGKYLEALQRDPDYPDPLKALEDEFFQNGRSSQTEQALREFLEKGNLPGLAGRYNP